MTHVRGELFVDEFEIVRQGVRGMESVAILPSAIDFPHMPDDMIDRVEAQSKANAKELVRRWNLFEEE